MNIRQIEAFHAVMETGSATRAAERLGITQPAISKLLKALRDDCGFLLFQRRGGQLTPTREAQALASEVSKLFNGAKRIKEVARAIRENEWGQITIAAPPAFSIRFLPFILARNFDRLDMRIQVQSRTSPQILDLVATQQVDIGLSTIPVDHPDVTSRRLMSFPLVCMLPAGHHLAKKQSLHISDIQAEAFISLPSSDCSFTRAERVFQVHSAPTKGRIEVPFSETAAMLVAQGVGVTIVPPFVGLEFDETRIVRRVIEPVEEVELWMLTAKQRQSPLVVDLLADLLTDLFQRLGRTPMSSMLPEIVDFAASKKR